MATREKNWPYRKFLRGKTVYRKGGVWSETTEPSWSTIEGADIVPVADRPGGERTDGTDRERYLFIGGHVYTVSNAVSAALIAAGYSTT